MKRLIAVGTKDGKHLNGDHFGQSKIFSIFELVGDKIIKREERDNPYYGKHIHAKVEDILEVIGDCKIWIGKSMGKVSMNKLKELDYTPFLTTEDDAFEAVKKFFSF